MRGSFTTCLIFAVILSLEVFTEAMASDNELVDKSDSRDDGHDLHLMQIQRRVEQIERKKGFALIVVFFGLFIISMIFIRLFLKRREHMIIDYSTQLRNSTNEKDLVWKNISFLCKKMPQNIKISYYFKFNLCEVLWKFNKLCISFRIINSRTERKG